MNSETGNVSDYSQGFFKREKLHVSPSLELIITVQIYK